MNWCRPRRRRREKAGGASSIAARSGWSNLGPSPDEQRLADLELKIRSLLRGHYKIGVFGKGGVGKTTVAASVGSIFAELRQDDRVVAIDADTAFGKLGSRIDPNAAGSYWELAADEHLDTFADVRSRVGNNSAGLFVLAGESSTARRRVLDPAIYREATARLDRHFTISIVDCGSTMDSAIAQEVLRDLDALIVVSSPWVDGASAAGQTMEWLANRGYTGLLHRTVVVLNDSDGHADKRTRSILVQQFASRGQVVVEVPFDSHLRPGGVIDVTSEMSPVDTAALHRDHRGARRALRVHHRRTAGPPVTTFREPAPSPAGHTATPVEAPPSCRVSILAGDSHQIDLVLPSAAPLNTLVDPTVIAINKVLRGRGAAELPPAAYEFAHAAASQGTDHGVAHGDPDRSDPRRHGARRPR